MGYLGQNTVTFTEHQAASPAGDGTQRCSRCGTVIRESWSEFRPWRPGSRVVISETGRVRMEPRALSYPLCDTPQE